MKCQSIFELSRVVSSGEIENPPCTISSAKPNVPSLDFQLDAMCQRFCGKGSLSCTVTCQLIFGVAAEIFLNLNPGFNALRCSRANQSRVQSPTMTRSGCTFEYTQ